MKKYCLLAILLCLLPVPELNAQVDVNFDSSGWLWTSTDEASLLHLNFNAGELTLTAWDVDRFVLRDSNLRPFVQIDAETPRFAFGPGATYDGIFTIGGETGIVFMDKLPRLVVTEEGFQGYYLAEFGKAKIGRDGVAIPGHYTEAELPLCDDDSDGLDGGIAFNTTERLHQWCDGIAQLWRNL